ncbi:sigma-70 family RNA polymerase sigma factor [Aestuariirhabdus litorea]|uniref:Sigma-70 family RNA polymerase sigma factor n=1 Tax=Aestuariirhabdus litorea TaxID=2528527 RepID=A0A3P3VQ33_9GAMM|nr:sigma-70 family RNA polymerase sigma factor [Aestuariirhabdus litorea]RRJ83776.1 sigma-70 family RNA polymerase sigma factor [Aestuariirhabdus litorea]RWW96999.1 sigma-70 family RNA polymerase sigma factor [Endozoicomonadaceae bacterium GTF-13]
MAMRTLDQLDDHELMQRYGEGEVAAFEQLYQRHRQGLYRYFLRQCGQPALAEDLYQEVWSRVIGAARRYRPDARFDTWLYRIAHNRLVDHYRRPSLVGSEPTETVEAVEPGPVEAAEQQQQAQRLHHCLGQLPALQLEAFMLKEEVGFSAAAVAEVVGASLEATKSRLRYAYQKLRECVTQTGEEVRDERA